MGEGASLPTGHDLEDHVAGRRGFQARHGRAPVGLEGVHQDLDGILSLDDRHHLPVPGHRRPGPIEGAEDGDAVVDDSPLRMDPCGVGEVGGEHPPEAHHLLTGSEIMEFLQRLPALVLGAGVEDEPHIYAPHHGRQELLDKGRETPSPPDLEVGKLQDDAVLGPPDDLPEMHKVGPPVLGADQKAGLARVHDRGRPRRSRRLPDPRPINVLRGEGLGSELEVMFEDGHEVRCKGNAVDDGAPAPAAERCPIPGREGTRAPVLGGDHHR